MVGLSGKPKESQNNERGDELISFSIYGNHKTDGGGLVGNGGQLFAILCRSFWEETVSNQSAQINSAPEPTGAGKDGLE